MQRWREKREREGVTKKTEREGRGGRREIDGERERKSKRERKS